MMNFYRSEPKCITCDLEWLTGSWDYYENCSSFEVYIVPTSSISTKPGVEYYILECRGPGLPLAGKNIRKYLTIFSSSLSQFS